VGRPQRAPNSGDDKLLRGAPAASVSQTHSSSLAPFPLVTFLTSLMNFSCYLDIIFDMKDQIIRIKYEYVWLSA
jgi:hypothetical protein